LTGKTQRFSEWFTKKGELRIIEWYSGHLEIIKYFCCIAFELRSEEIAAKRSCDIISAQNEIFGVKPVFIFRMPSMNPTNLSTG
jgi:hypothetical protein